MRMHKRCSLGKLVLAEAQGNEWIFYVITKPAGFHGHSRSPAKMRPQSGRPHAQRVRRFQVFLCALRSHVSHVHFRRLHADF